METDNNILGSSARFLFGIFLMSGYVCEAQDLWLGKILATAMCGEMSSFQSMSQLSGKRLSNGGENQKECEWLSWPKCATPGSCKHTTKNTCTGETGSPPGSPPPGPPESPAPGPSGSPPPGPPGSPPPGPPSGPVETGDGQMWIGKILTTVMCGEMSSFQSMGQLSNKKITDAGLSADRKKECEWYSWPKCATPGSCKLTTKNTCTGETGGGAGPAPSPPPSGGGPSPPPSGGEPSPPPSGAGPPPEQGSPSGPATGAGGQHWIGKSLSTVLCGEMSSFQSMGQLSNKKLTDPGAERKTECDWYSWPKCATPGSCKLTTKNTCTGETGGGAGPAPSPPPSGGEPSPPPSGAGPPPEQGSPSGPATGAGGQHWIGKSLSTVLCGEMSSFQSMGQLSNKKLTDAGTDKKTECDWYSWPKCGTPGSCKLTTKKTC